MGRHLEVKFTLLNKCNSGRSLNRVLFSRTHLRRWESWRPSPLTRVGFYDNSTWVTHYRVRREIGMQKVIEPATQRWFFIHLLFRRALTIARILGSIKW